MESRAETPAPAAPTGPSIPSRFFLEAAQDKDLKLLLRQKETAERRVQRALEGVADIEVEIAAYIADKYPSSTPAEPVVSA